MKPSLLASLLLIALLIACAPGVPSTPILPSAAPLPTVNPNLLPVRGLYVQFERRGAPEQYWSGQVLQDFDTFDSLVGHTPAEEVALQLDEMARLGVNTITYELRSSSPKEAGSNFAPPICPLPPVLGLQYPQPTELELRNLVAFLDLLHSKGMQLHLRLVNTHFDEQPPTGNSLWLGSILNAIKDHPALDLVLFEGSAFLVDTNGDGSPDQCGGPVEPPLWDGPGSLTADYIQWALSYSHSLGLPYRLLSAEAIVGDYYAFMQGPSGPSATDSHQWDPVFTMKTIFDNLNVPAAERTYALSFYEHPKCLTARQLICVENGPHAWAIETAQHVRAVVGYDSPARVVVPEMGLHTNYTGRDWHWTTEQALASLVWVMKQYGFDGGSFWRWTDFYDSEEHDPRLAIPVKPRGAGFTYNPVAKTLKQLYTVGSVPASDFDPAAEATAAFVAATGAAATAEGLNSLPVDDSFDLPAIDDRKWQVFVNPGASFAVQDGRIAFSTDAAHVSNSASTVPHWFLTGDFDLQVDWALADDWTPPAADHDDAAFLMVGMGRPQRFWITRIADPGGEAGRFMAYGEAAGQIGDPVATSARAGTFRLVRTGDSLAFFYDVGSGWQQLATVTVPTAKAQIRIGVNSVNSSHAFTTYFDNFVLSSGPYDYEP